MRRRVTGLILFSVGIGILLTLFVPIRFWSFAVAVLLIGTGLFFLRCG